jgi:hypothetical protein
MAASAEVTKGSSQLTGHGGRVHAVPEGGRARLGAFEAFQ